MKTGAENILKARACVCVCFAVAVAAQPVSARPLPPESFKSREAGSAFEQIVRKAPFLQVIMLFDLYRNRHSVLDPANDEA